MSYETPTRSGVTGAEGEFHYEQGESVRFTVGDTLLGEVSGAAQVSPFDLAASHIVTGTPDVIQALQREHDPFHTVINITTLLQSLDEDADPENGIGITPEVASLFQGVSLDMSQNWETFPGEASLLNIMEQATSQGFFNEPRRIVNPAAALQHLYESLGEDARTLALSVSQDAGGEAVRYVYDTDGYLRRAVSPDWYMEGDEAPHYLTQDYEYDTWGNLIRFEERNYVEFELEFSGEAVLYRNLAIYIETRTYNEDGTLRRIERESGNQSLGPDDPGVLEDVPLQNIEDWRYGYGPGRELLGVDVDFYADDTSASTNATFQYDQAGNLALIEMQGAHVPTVAGALGIPAVDLLYLAGGHAASYSVAYEFGPGGAVTRDIRDGNRPDFGRIVETRDYDANGKLTRLESRQTLYGDSPDNDQVSLTLHDYEYNDNGDVIRDNIDLEGDGSQDRTDSWRYEYDERGELLRREFDAGSDGAVDEVTLWEYDDRGNPTRMQVDSDGDGFPEDITSRVYDGEGYLIQDGDRSLQYEPAGWGHIFSLPPLRDPAGRQ